MTTTNAQLQAFAHNGGGKRKHATTADADILPGVFDCRKRARCRVCERGRAYDSPDVDKGGYDFEFEVKQEELDAAGMLLEPASKSQKSRARYNKAKGRHGYNEYKQEEHPFHLTYNADPDGFAQDPPDFAPAKTAIDQAIVAEKAATAVDAAVEQATEGGIEKAEAAASEAAAAAAAAATHAAQAEQVAAAAKVRQEASPNSEAAVLGASRAAALASKAAAAAARAKQSAEDAAKGAQSAKAAVDKAAEHEASIVVALQVASAKDALSCSVEEEAYRLLHPSVQPKFSTSRVVLAPEMITAAAEFAMQAATMYCTPSRHWKDATPSPTWWCLALSLEAIAAELARRGSKYAIVAILAGEIAHAAFPHASAPCGGRRSKNALAFWWDAKYQGRAVHAADATTDGIMLPVDHAMPTVMATIDLGDQALMAALYAVVGSVPSLPRPTMSTQNGLPVVASGEPTHVLLDDRMSPKDVAISQLQSHALAAALEGRKTFLSEYPSLHFRLFYNIVLSSKDARVQPDALPVLETCLAEAARRFYPNTAPPRAVMLTAPSSGPSPLGIYTHRLRLHFPDIVVDMEQALLMREVAIEALFMCDDARIQSLCHAWRKAMHTATYGTPVQVVGAWAIEDCSECLNKPKARKDCAGCGTSGRVVVPPFEAAATPLPELLQLTTIRGGVATSSGWTCVPGFSVRPDGGFDDDNKVLRSWSKKATVENVDIIRRLEFYVRNRFLRSRYGRLRVVSVVRDMSTYYIEVDGEGSSFCCNLIPAHDHPRNRIYFTAFKEGSSGHMQMRCFCRTTEMHERRAKCPCPTFKSMAVSLDKKDTALLFGRSASTEDPE